MSSSRRGRVRADAGTALASTALCSTPAAQPPHPKGRKLVSVDVRDAAMSVAKITTEHNI